MSVEGRTPSTVQALAEAAARLKALVEVRDGSRPEGPEIDVDALLGRRASDSRAAPGPADAPQRPAHLPWVTLPRFWAPASELPEREAYDLGELLAYHDVEFVRNAYRALLRRAPDAGGLAHHVQQLHRDEVSKVQLLASIRGSEEGRARSVKVRGLRAAVLVRSMRRIPLLGPLLEMLFYFARMPTIVRNIERQEIHLFRRERELRGILDTLAIAAEGSLNAAATMLNAAADDLARQQHDKAARSTVERLGRQLAGLLGEVWRLRSDVDTRPSTDEVARLAEAVHAAAAMLDEARARAAERLAGVEQVVDEAQARATIERRAAAERAEADAAAMGAAIERLAAVEQAKADASEVRAALERLDAVKANEQAVATLFADTFTRERLEAIMGEGGNGLDDFYVAFEERFRGPREDIKRLMAVHLPAVQAAGAGGRLKPVLDIGCGRGEWLEVLGEAGLTARGVDLNGAMARQCRERGLDVTEGDAIAYLREQPEGSFGAVTAMHVIEHLTFERLVELFDEAHRALAPGGVVIFETPNPENLQVGSCNFWYDPTHLRPIPPLAAQFIAQERGFARAEIMRLHPYPLDDHPQSGDTELRDRMVRLLYGPQDYAIVAWKG